MEGISSNKQNKNEELKISVERGKPEDLEDYKSIRLEALYKFPKAFGKKWEDEMNKTDKKWKEELEDEKEPVFFAKESSKIIGMAKIYERKKEEKNCWCIVSVYVSKPFQGRDIGRKIIETVEYEILKRGGKKAVLYAWEGDEKNDKNKKVKDFYERLGYKIVPEKKYEIWDRMEKVLSA